MNIHIVLKYDQTNKKVLGLSSLDHKKSPLRKLVGEEARLARLSLLVKTKHSQNKKRKTCVINTSAPYYYRQE